MSACCPLRRSVCLKGILLLLLLPAGASAQTAATEAVKPPWKTYQTQYYLIHTDLDADTVREATARMTSMAEEYHQRTEGFAGTIRERLPFHLFSDPKDYYAAGGTLGSAGQYDGTRLMAVASKRYGDRVWHVVQHEGFHQFAHRVIRGRIPVWVNEGLAEYFGLGIWTGDNYVTGIVPPSRLGRLKAHIEGGRLLPFSQMLSMDYREWVSSLGGANYDQAWSMVHFLVHAEGGKYRRPFEAFIKDVSRAQPSRQAFYRRFGRDIEGFEKQCKQWWSLLPENPTAERYTLADVETLTSYLARAQLSGQKFSDVKEFFDAADAGQLKMPQERWLPAKLLNGAMLRARGLERWSLGKGRYGSTLILTQANGHTFTGAFAPEKGFVKVRVDVKKTPPSTAPAGQSDSAPSAGSH